MFRKLLRRSDNKNSSTHRRLDTDSPPSPAASIPLELNIIENYVGSGLTPERGGGSSVDAGSEAHGSTTDAQPSVMRASIDNSGNPALFLASIVDVEVHRPTGSILSTSLTTATGSSGNTPPPIEADVAMSPRGSSIEGTASSVERSASSLDRTASSLDRASSPRAPISQPLLPAAPVDIATNAADSTAPVERWSFRKAVRVSSSAQRTKLRAGVTTGATAISGSSNAAAAAAAAQPAPVTSADASLYNSSNTGDAGVIFGADGNAPAASSLPFPSALRASPTEVQQHPLPVSADTAALAQLQSHAAPPPFQPQLQLQSRCVDLWTHGGDFNSDALVLNPDVFVGWLPGDFVEITAAPAQAVAATEKNSAAAAVAAANGGISNAASESSSASSSCNSSGVTSRDGPAPRGAVILQLGSIAPVKGSLAASIRSTIAESAGFRARDPVLLTRIPDAQTASVSFGLSHVELSFRDQYASRSGLWRFRRALHGAVLHVGQHLTLVGLRVQVRELSRPCSTTTTSAAASSSPPASVAVPKSAAAATAAAAAATAAASVVSASSCVSGVVTASTKVTFRTRSSHLVLLVQMSREMWQFDNHGEMAFEKVCA